MLIKAAELRVIGPAGENYGVLPFAEAMKKAEEHGLDLLEISPTANPPIAKIMDYGKYQYEEAKKAKAAKAKMVVTEIKTLQVKIGTGDHDLELKAKKASEWLAGGNRIKVDLFLPGRTKYMDFNFLKERLNRLLSLITVEYRVADGPSKSMKGLTVIVERGSAKAAPKPAVSAPAATPPPASPSPAK
jgi:translation initiation factor IF-3